MNSTEHEIFIVHRDDDWGDDDEDWGEDVSEEAVKRRMKDLTSGVANLAMNDDLEKTETERINLFHDFVKKLIDEVRMANTILSGVPLYVAA